MSLAAAAAADGRGSECGTETMVPSSLTWAFSVILSMPEGHNRICVTLEEKTMRMHFCVSYP